LAGPGTARKFDYEELQEITPLRRSSSLVVVEEKGDAYEAGHDREHVKGLLAVMRLFVMAILLAVGVVLIVTLSSYLMVFHSVKAEGVGNNSIVGEISRMKQYSESINIYDIGNSYYPVAVKVER
jgi:hypothetical protein